MYVNIYVCVWVFIFICIYTYIHAHVCVCIDMVLHQCVRVCARGRASERGYLGGCSIVGWRRQSDTHLSKPTWTACSPAACSRPSVAAAPRRTDGCHFCFFGVARRAVRQKFWKSQCPSVFTMCSDSIRTFENACSLPLPETKP
jgi:hypothetical protein